MSNREFSATRTMLANAMATAGAELLEYMGAGGALAAIPNTEPQQYVVAGTLGMIGKMLPADGLSAAGAAKGGITSLEGLARYGWTENTSLGMIDLLPRQDGAYVKFADVERLLANAASVPPLTAPAPLTDDALRKLCDQLDGMKRRMRHTPGTGQNHSYLLAEDVDAYVEEARKSLSGAPAPQQSELTDQLKQLRNRVSQLEAARIGYASEFPLTADGEPDVGNIHANIRALKAKAAPAPQQSDLTDELRERVRDAVAQALDGIYYCGRVWSAWQVNTMREDDFTPAAEVDDVLDGIVDAALSEVAKAAPAAPVQTNDVRPTDSPDLSINSVAFFSALIEYGNTPTLAKRLEVADIIDSHIDRIVELYSGAAPVQAEQAQAEPVAKAELWDAIHQYVSDYGDEFRVPPTTGAAKRCNASRDELAAVIDKLYGAPALPAQAEQVEAVRAALDDAKEAAEILDSFLDNVATDGPYGAEASLTFISQAKQCIDGTIRALATPSTATSNDTGALGENLEDQSRADEDWFFHPNDE
jgi:hypothetical protein